MVFRWAARRFECRKARVCDRKKMISREKSKNRSPRIGTKNVAQRANGDAMKSAHKHNKYYSCLESSFCVEHTTEGWRRQAPKCSHCWTLLVCSFLLHFSLAVYFFLSLARLLDCLLCLLRLMLLASVVIVVAEVYHSTMLGSIRRHRRRCRRRRISSTTIASVLPLPLRELPHIIQRKSISGSTSSNRTKCISLYVCAVCPSGSIRFVVVSGAACVTKLAKREAKTFLWCDDDCSSI